MGFLQKLRGLPEPQRKLILWGVVIILGLLLFLWWVKNVRDNLQSFVIEELPQQFQFPEISKIEIPALELPELSEEEIRQLEKQLNGE